MSYVGKVTVDRGATEHLVGSTLYGTCSTPAGTAAKVVSCPDFDKLIVGVTIHVKFTETNTNSATLNVNGTGAKPIISSGQMTSGVVWGVGAIVAFTYDGTSWIMNGWEYGSDTKNTAGSNNTTSKLFLIGAPSQAANPQTYSNSSVYEQNGALHATTFNGYTLGAASEKAIGSVASGNTGLVTGGAVYNAIQAASAGSLSYGGVVTTEAGLGTSYTSGTYWIVGTVSAGTTIGGEVVEAGDMIIAHSDYSGTVANDIDIVQSNVERLTDSDIDAAIAEAEAA